LSVLHPDCDYFWQRPKPIEKNCWYLVWYKGSSRQKHFRG
jgi:hypothetical protein